MRNYNNYWDESIAGFELGKNDGVDVGKPVGWNPRDVGGYTML
jgi:hypothetical protein